MVHTCAQLKLCHWLSLGLVFFFWLYHAACGILVPWTGVKPIPNCWIARKFPRFAHLGDCPGNVNEWMHRASWILADSQENPLSGGSWLQNLDRAQRRKKGERCSQCSMWSCEWDTGGGDASLDSGARSPRLIFWKYDGGLQQINKDSYSERIMKGCN